MLLGPHGEVMNPMGGIADDAVMGIALAEQRIKGVLIGAVAGAVGMGIVAYMFGPELLAMVGAAQGARKKNPSGPCNTCPPHEVGRRYKVGP